MKVRVDNYTLFIIILFVSGVVVNSGFGFLGYIAFFLLLILVVNNSIEKNIYIVLSIIPCIRIYDASGNINLINLIILFISLKYIIIEKRMTSRKNTMRILLLYFGLECIHWLNYNDINTIVMISIKTLFNIYVCFSLLFDDSVQLNKEKLYGALCNGVFISSFVFFVVNGLSYLLNYVNGKSRLEAYGSDPNYYSIYIILALYGVTYYGTYSLTQIIRIFLLILLELLTASKMGLLSIVFLLGYVFSEILKNKGFRKVTFRVVVVIIVFVLIQKDYIVLLIEKVLSRFTYGSEIVTLNEISSGRFDIVKNNFYITFNKLFNCILGFGLGYGHQSGLRVAHNTFLDVFFSWGIIGSIITGALLFLLIKNFINYSKTNITLLLIFSFMLCTLSCITSDMFWYILYLVIYSISKNNNYKKEETVLS